MIRKLSATRNNVAAQRVTLWADVGVVSCVGISQHEAGVEQVMLLAQRHALQASSVIAPGTRWWRART